MNNKFNGEGIYTYNDNKTYIGGFLDGKKHGAGKISFPDGSFY